MITVFTLLFVTAMLTPFWWSLATCWREAWAGRPGNLGPAIFLSVLLTWTYLLFGIYLAGGKA
jgi:hypothetical protein